jgi:dihydroorotase-like cyclic amidohydrolase
LSVTVAASRLRAKSKNMPFEGWQLRGGVAATLVGGRLVYANPDIQQLGLDDLRLVNR